MHTYRSLAAIPSAYVSANRCQLPGSHSSHDDWVSLQGKKRGHHASAPHPQNKWSRVRESLLDSAPCPSQWKTRSRSNLRRPEHVAQRLQETQLEIHLRGLLKQTPQVLGKRLPQQRKSLSPQGATQEKEKERNHTHMIVSTYQL